MRKSNSAILVCENSKSTGEKEVVGSIHIETDGEDAHVAMLAVDPEIQAGGIGRRLMAAAEERALHVFGCRRMGGEVISGRPELMAWYLRLGYRETGEKGPFFGPEHGVTPLVEGLHFVLIDKML